MKLRRPNRFLVQHRAEVQAAGEFGQGDQGGRPVVRPGGDFGARGGEADPYLGLYGAFGYDLVFQLDPIRLRMPRPATGEGTGADRDLVLYLPDSILVVDHQAATAEEHRFDFTTGGRSTIDLPRTGVETPWRAAETVGREADHRPGEYADCVRAAHGFFRRGDLFEVVPGQSFFARCPAPPSEVFRRLRARNPAPYGALMNLGESEYLVAASPEMYVRVDGRRIETCPISGTVARGADAIGDAEQILKLLSSEKEASELTMCTDVDRNDKSRVCEPGSVRVIGRRQIEMYSRLIHTVDHVEGRLRERFDARPAERAARFRSPPRGVRFPGPTRKFGQGILVGWAERVPVLEASGARPIRVPVVARGRP